MPHDLAENLCSKFQFYVILYPLPAHCFCNKAFTVIVSLFLTASLILCWKMLDISVTKTVEISLIVGLKDMEFATRI